MAGAPILTHDVLLDVAPYLRERALLKLAATNRELKEPLTRYALRRALRQFNFDLKRPNPITHAIRTGDSRLLSQALDMLDSLDSPGWQWSPDFNSPVDKMLFLAATCSLKSLEYLTQRYSLVGGLHEDLRNRRLVRAALSELRYDCASYLIRDHVPALFPGGFCVRSDRVCFAEATTLQFLIDRGAELGPEPLHRAASLPNLSDSGVFDVLIENGFREKIDSLSYAYPREPVTPLLMACERIQPTNVEALLRLGANPNGISMWVGSDTPLVRPTLGVDCMYSIPFLKLLFSLEWDALRHDYQAFGQRFLECFQLLRRYGATMSISISYDKLLKILLLRIWKILCWQLWDDAYLAPLRNQDHPNRIELLLSNMERPGKDVSPWDEVYHVVSGAHPRLRADCGQKTDKARLIQLFRDYAVTHGRLPGPFGFSLPLSMTS